MDLASAQPLTQPVASATRPLGDGYRNSETPLGARPVDRLQPRSTTRMHTSSRGGETLAASAERGSKTERQLATTNVTFETPAAPRVALQPPMPAPTPPPPDGTQRTGAVPTKPASRRPAQPRQRSR